MENKWAMQDAKARLSEVIRAADEEPQCITLRGEEKVFVVSATQYRRLTGRRKRKEEMSFYELWKSAPKVPEFKLPERKREKMRKVF